MAEDKIKDLQIDLSPQVEAKIAEDPALAEALRDMIACFRQAHQAVQEGRYANFEDAIEAITGTRPEPVDDDC